VRRVAIADALRKDGFELALVNGGGTGSLDSTTPESGVTEVAAGSGLFKPHLFDYYKSAYMRELEPAAFFALEIVRRPSATVVTCGGGGYIASGSAGPDKAPLPWLPRDLRLLPMEMAGEVQTPLESKVDPREDPLMLGAPVVFRHAKAGELMERFREVLLLHDGRIVDRVPTYRGLGWCFN
jgi:D-serine deaminase-like pyridoxal phosphate-dependent protein